MKYENRFRLPIILLVVLIILSAVVLASCRLADQMSEPNESEYQQTLPEETEPEETEPEQTQPEVPEETQSEETEPEQTESSDSGSSGPNINTGTGGGYDPGTSDPDATEPEATEPVIEVPPAGSEKNAYYENIQNGAGKFTTVKIPAGSTVYYRIQTAGMYLQVEDADAVVTYDGVTYEPQDGEVAVLLPEDDSQPLSLSFTNNGEEDKNFPVAIVGDLGSQSNPIEVESLDGVSVSLEQDDLDGLFYLWNADCDGMLKLWQESDSAVDLNVFVNDEAAQPTRDNGGKLSIQVEQDDEILIQIVAKADEEGVIPAAEATIRCYVAQMVKLSVMLVPFEAEPVTVEAGQSVYITVSGAAGKQLQIDGANAEIYYGEETLQPEEDTFKFSATENTVQFEICNLSDQAESYVLKVNHSVGNILNPEVFATFGDAVEVQTKVENGGYYYQYTAPTLGFVTFQIWGIPEEMTAKVQLTNRMTGETATVADMDSAATVTVSEGDEVVIVVSAQDASGADADGLVTIYGNHFGTEENPVRVEYPGFEAKVPAGKTLYYQCYKMNGLQFSLAGTDVTVAHNGKEYSGSSISFTIVSEDRVPAVFAITNTGEEDALYQGTFAYPLGWRENPEPLTLGTNKRVQKAGAADYFYIFTAPKDGRLVLTFDAKAQWTYVVNNLTQGIYGETQWSDSVPQMSRMELEVKENDQIQLSVNTYDKKNVNKNPAGRVVFEAEFLTGPVEIIDTKMVTTAALTAGETCEFTGKFQGLTMKITGDKNAVVEFGGNTYKADASGAVTVEIPEGDDQMLSFQLRNGATEQVEYTITFRAKNTGTAENPEVLIAGSYTMVQSVAGGSEYHYVFTSASKGALLFTFETDVNCVFTINGTIVRYTHQGQNKYAVSAKAGVPVTLVVNTYDPANPDVAPVGEVDFTVQFS